MEQAEQRTPILKPSSNSSWAPGLSLGEGFSTGGEFAPPEDI